MRGIRGIILLILVVVVALTAAFVIFWRSRTAAAYGSALALCPGPDQFGYTCADGDVFSYIDATNDIFLYVDDGVLPVALPFPFTFYGQTYEEVNVSSNGNLQFTTTAANFSNDCLDEAPALGLGPLIAPYWDDLDLRLEGFVETEVVGEAPDRIFVIEWDGVPHYGDETGATVSFEVQLFESSNDIVFLYADVLGPADRANGASATVGIQDETLGVTLQYSCNQSTVANPSGLQFLFPQDPNTDIENAAPAAPVLVEAAAAQMAAKGNVRVLLDALQASGAAALPELRMQWLQASPARATDWIWLDLTGDGADELVYLWRAPARQPALSEVAVMAPTPAGYELLYSGRLYTRSNPVGVPQLGQPVDLTGDGRRDLLLTTSDGHLFMLTFARDADLTVHQVPGACQGSQGVMDVNGDDRPEIVRDGCATNGRVTQQWVQGRFITRK